MRWMALLLGAALMLPASVMAADGDDAAEASKKKKRTKKSAKKSSKKSTKKTSKKRRKKRRKKPVEIPVDVAFGPAFHWMTGPIQDDQAPHYGVKVSVKAIIDQALIKANKHRIPKKYRGMASRVKEARISPSIFIPDTLFISPKSDKVGMYGVNFRPLAIDMPLIRSPRLALSAGLDLTYLYIDGEDAALGTTHFLRPGLDLKAELEIPLSKTFLISGGWQSMFYPPQELGGEIFAWGELEKSVWHIGQAFVLLHFRFPYKVSI